MGETIESGIDQLKKLIKELVTLGTVVDAKLADGWQWTDAFPIAMEGKNLVFVATNWNEIKAEFNDLSVDELEQLITELETDLNIANDKVKSLIDQSVAFAEAGYNLFQAIKAMNATPAV